MKSRSITPALRRPASSRFSSTSFPGGFASHGSLNGTPEFAYGVTEWWEVGLYLPFAVQNRQFLSDSFKLRTLFVSPNAEQRNFFYGVNFEFSNETPKFAQTRFAMEIRPIIGWHFKRFDLIFNPIIDTAYDGFGNLEFVPAVRVAFNVAPKWQVAVEHYANYGHFKDFYSKEEQSHNIYAVVDHDGKTWDFEFGVGFGLTDASDKLTFKMILAHDLKTRKPKSRS